MNEQETKTQPEPLDKFKTVVVYGTAAITVLGGLAVITFLMITDKLGTDAGLPALLLVVGGAVTFLLGEQQSKRTEASMERANLVARSTVDGYVQAPNAPRQSTAVDRPNA